MLDWEIENIEYECTKCCYRFKGSELKLIQRIACPQCGCRVLRKTRPPIVKRVKAV